MEFSCTTPRPHAWYHCYFESDASNNVKMWVNGTQQPSTKTFSGFNDPLNFGHEASTAVGSGFDGYLSQIYLIEGQHLGVNSFARFDINGAWFCYS